MERKVISSVEVAASAAVSADGNTDAVATERAREIVFEIIPTASTTADFDFTVQTTYDRDDSPTFVAVNTATNVTTHTARVLVTVRIETGILGVSSRLAWVRNGGSLTFSVKAHVKEDE